MSGVVALLMQAEAEKKRAAKERSSATAQPLSYGLRQAADVLGLSREMVRLEVVRGKISAKRAGRRLLIPAAALKQYLDALEDA